MRQYCGSPPGPPRVERGDRRRARRNSGGSSAEFLRKLAGFAARAIERAGDVHSSFPESGTILGGFMPSQLVTAAGLVKRYQGKETPAVDGISFEIAEGETIGLLGPNGAGKTTLIKMICGITPPTAGDIRVIGVDPSRDPLTAKTAIAAMHQSGPFDQMLSAVDNLKIAARFRGVSWRAVQSWVLELAGYLGVTPALGQPVFQLSGGQSRRLQLVRALITVPRLLILDEPSAGLDLAGRNQLGQFVGWLQQEYGVTVLWSSHHIDELERNCQRVLVINRGKALRFASPRELVQEFGETSAVLVTVDDPMATKVVKEWAETAGLVATVQDTEVRIEGAATRDVMRPLLSHCEASGTVLSGISTTTSSLEAAFLRMTEGDR
jgi:ABC-2 type transport system ATP-binding protein